MAKATPKGADAVAIATDAPKVDVEELALARKAEIDNLLETIARGCSTDMHESEMWSRTLQRLKDWGATALEIAEAMPRAQAVAAEVAKKNADALAKRRAMRAMRTGNNDDALFRG